MMSSQICINHLSSLFCWTFSRNSVSLYLYLSLTLGISLSISLSLSSRVTWMQFWISHHSSMSRDHSFKSRARSRVVLILVERDLSNVTPTDLLNLGKSKILAKWKVKFNFPEQGHDVGCKNTTPGMGCTNRQTEQQTALGPPKTAHYWVRGWRRYPSTNHNRLST